MSSFVTFCNTLVNKDLSRNWRFAHDLSGMKYRVLGPETERIGPLETVPSLTAGLVASRRRALLDRVEKALNLRSLRGVGWEKFEKRSSLRSGIGPTAGAA